MASVAPLIVQLARQMGLDPNAVLAVARGEGGLVNRPGTQDIGDLAGGGSYGPFQLYAKGALPRHLVGNQAAADAWAWSPNGIRYALSKMAPFAKGRTGADAVRQIVTRFERPANPQASIAAALGRLGQGGTNPVVPGRQAPAPGIPSGPGGGDKLAQIQAMFQNRGQGPLRMLQALQAAGPQTPPGAPVSPSKGIPAPGGPGAAGGVWNPEELFYDPLGGFKYGQQTGAIGGHGTHVHVGETDPRQMLQIIALARRMGLRVSENPAVDHVVTSGHAPKSFHKRNTRLEGKLVGQGLDVGGNPKGLAAFYRSLAPRSKKKV